MKDSSDHTLNGGGIIPEHHDGSLIIIIHTTGGAILNPTSTNTIVDRSRLGPQVCFAPSNCFAYDSPNLMNSQVRGWGL